MDSDQLRDLLNHLYDPSYQVPVSILAGLGLSDNSGLPTVRARILALIDSLKPSADIPQDAAPWRLYRVLQARYVHDLTQRQAAEELAVTVRHLARLQNQAVDLLAEVSGQGGRMSGLHSGTGSVRQQIAQEVTSLYEQADEAVYELTETVQAAVELAMPMALAQHTAIHFTPPSVTLWTAAPQAAVRQAVLSGLTYLLRLLSDGEVRVTLGSAEAGVEIELVGRPVSGACPDEPWLVHELLSTARGELECSRQDNCLCLVLRLPPEPGACVLAIDDNSDQLHFYGRCVAGSHFSIEPLRDGRRGLAVARDLLPDAIVLDVMLPNTDGWELLTQLANDPMTRDIPVIICSVVNESELALSLGASLVVAKPVSRVAFLAALQQVLPNGARAHH